MLFKYFALSLAINSEIFSSFPEVMDKVYYTLKIFLTFVVLLNCGYVDDLQLRHHT